MRTSMAAIALLACLLVATFPAPAAGHLKVDEPGFQIALSTQTAGTTPGCPAGFYALRLSDGAEPGNVPGFFSSELLLQAPGSRVFAGGFNFGGLQLDCHRRCDFRFVYIQQHRRVVGYSRRRNSVSYPDFRFWL